MQMTFNLSLFYHRFTALDFIVCVRFNNHMIINFFRIRFGTRFLLFFLFAFLYFISVLCAFFSKCLYLIAFS